MKPSKKTPQIVWGISSLIAIVGIFVLGYWQGHAQSAEELRAVEHYIWRNNASLEHKCYFDCDSVSLHGIWVAEAKTCYCKQPDNGVRLGTATYAWAVTA